MSRILLIILVGFSVFALVGCGDDCGGLCGSQCDRIDCSFHTIACMRSGTAIKVDFLRNPTTAREWAAQIVFDVEGINPVEGYRFEDIDNNKNFSDRITLLHPGSEEQFPELKGNYCEISSGGDTVEKDMSGKCSFAFITGYFMTAEFSCLLEPPPL